MGGAVAEIGEELCLGCGICEQVCRSLVPLGKPLWTVISRRTASCPGELRQAGHNGQAAGALAGHGY